jgi:hypothetical protein
MRGRLLLTFLACWAVALAQPQTDQDSACPLFTADVRKRITGGDVVYVVHFNPLDPRVKIEGVEVQYALTNDENEVNSIMSSEQFQFSHRMSAMMDANMKLSFITTLPTQLVEEGGTLLLKFIYSTQIEGTTLSCTSEINLAELPVPSEDTMTTHAAQPVRGGGFGGFRGGLGGMGGMGGMGRGGWGGRGGFGGWRRGRFPWGRGYPPMMYPPYGYPGGGGGGFPDFPEGGGFPPGGDSDDMCEEGEMMAEDGTCVPIPTTGGRGRGRGRGGGTGASGRRETRCPEGYTYDVENRLCEVTQETVRSPIYFAAPIQLSEGRPSPYQGQNTQRLQMWYS